MPSSGCKKCARSEEHTSELQSHSHLVCRLLLEKKNLHRQSSCWRRRTWALVTWLGVTKTALASVCRRCFVRAFPSGLGVTRFFFLFFFNDTATTEISTLPLHDALPISVGWGPFAVAPARRECEGGGLVAGRG